MVDVWEDEFDKFRSGSFGRLEAFVDLPIDDT